MVQHSSFLSFSSMFFLAQVGIALAVSYFLFKWVDIFRLPLLRLAYWVITVFTYTMVFFRRTILESDYGSWDGLVTFFLSLSYVWPFALLVTLVGFIFIFLAHFLVRIKNFLTAPRKEPLPAANNVTRRSFLKTASLVWPCLSLGLAAEGVVNAHTKIVLNKQQIFLPGLAPALDGFKIAQISDTHIGAYFGMAELKKVLAMLAAEKPDLLVITGDFIDDRELLPETFVLLDPFAAELPYGAYFCWGNHEYFRNNFNAIKQYFDQSPITVLRNENKLAVPAATPLYLVGVDYPGSGRGIQKAPVRQKMLSQAREGLPENALPILIAHHSDYIDEAFAAGIPFTITGHTHGGQAALF
ncbi:MAG: metallophosphoesterase [Sporomusaceae bacterium]|jgi:predicted MPP superfamily phosphohydrolase|nr:metallophosphoesterase [Sporomusaceae bacterium]